LARLRISCGLRKVLGNPKDNYDVSASVFVVQFNIYNVYTNVHNMEMPIRQRK